MTTVNLHTAYLSIIAITIIITANMALITLRVFGNIGIAQGQGNNVTSSLTSQQKAAMCNPSDKFVNDTESSICGIPKTPTNMTTSAVKTTTGTEAPSPTPGTSIAPSDTTPTIPKQSPLYEQGYAKGVADAKSVQGSFPASSTTMSPDEVDCDSDIDPQASNEEYCSGYQHGFADTNDELLGK
jgi:hypothetical protein